MAQNMDPKTVLGAFVGGDRGVFPDVVRSLRRRLLNYAYAYLSNWEDCKDVVQESFIRLYQKSGSITGNPLSWIFSVTRNICIDHIRKGKRHGEVPIDNVNRFPNGKNPGPDLKLQVNDALKELSDRDRSIVLMKVLEGMSYKEIAEVLDLTPSNVGYILHHGLRKLASHLTSGGVS